MDYFQELATAVRSYSADRELSILDGAREFLHAYTIHGDVAWWAQYGNDPFYIAENTYKQVVGDPTAEAPEVLCGNLVDVFGGLCSDLGLQSRSVWLYSDSQGYFQGHTY